MKARRATMAVWHQGVLGGIGGRAAVSRLLLVAAAIGVGSLVALTLGCDCVETCDDRDHPPAVPTGVGSITGDTFVIVYWNPVYEEDLAGYGVYRSRQDEGPYSRIGEVARGEATEFRDEDLTNGTTYYYAVDAFDYAGHESDLSYETVDDTPRPEGWNFTWYTKQYKPLEAGIAIIPDDYDALVWMPYNSVSAQYYLTADDGGCMRIVAWNDMHGFPNLIQDYGHTYSPDEVDNAPTEGWSSCAGGVEVIPKHTYVLKTSTGYYGKIWVKEMGSEGIIVYWAFQGKRGSTELAPAYGGGTRRG